MIVKVTKEGNHNAVVGSFWHVMQVRPDNWATLTTWMGGVCHVPVDCLVEATDAEVASIRAMEMWAATQPEQIQ